MSKAQQTRMAKLRREKAAPKLVKPAKEKEAANG